MSKVLKDSLIRKNRHMYKTALRAVEKVMGNGFQYTEKFGAIRDMILNTGNEIERSILTELDEYAIVYKNGSRSHIIRIGEYIKSLVPNIQFAYKESIDGAVPFMKLIAKDIDDNLAILREIMECGSIGREKGYPCFSVVGLKDCLKIIPILDEIMIEIKNNTTYKGWTDRINKQYQEMGA